MLFRTSSRPEVGRFRRSRRALGTLTCGLALAVSGSAVTAPTAAAAPADGPIIFGANNSKEIGKLERNIGAPLAMHRFAKLSGPVRSGRLINIKPTVKWQVVANARWNSDVHEDIRRWADALKRRSESIMVTFSHEPEGKSSSWLGNNHEFKAAFRKVHNVFEARGASNVEMTWNATSHSFRVPPSDRRYYTKWYPGDAYVDNVATAAYNWDGCGPGGPYKSLGEQAAAPLKFAKSIGKPYILAEWASQKGPRRAEWLYEAKRWLIANRASIRGAFYFITNPGASGCTFRLTTDAEFRAFGSMAKDRENFTP